MSSSSPPKKKGMPDKDPYEALGLSFGASESAITKAYRNLARTLHPDKLVAQKLSEAELQEAAVRFHDLQNARAFLLDAAHAADRAAYDNWRASQRLRQETDRARERGMSERRKRLRAELQREEERVRRQQAQEQQPSGSAEKRAGRTAGAASNKKNQADLERQGRELREEYAAKAAAQARKEQQDTAAATAQRQIRLKWSRKKLKEAGESSPSEDSLARQLAQQFGPVQAVQMIGSKGNLALVTFVHDDGSCDRCVEAYSDSEIWRATRVGGESRQPPPPPKTKADDEAPPPQQPGTSLHHPTRDRENVDDWKLRQAAERERLLRQMEEEEGEDAPVRQCPKERGRRTTGATLSASLSGRVPGHTVGNVGARRKTHSSDCCGWAAAAGEVKCGESAESRERKDLVIGGERERPVYSIFLSKIL